MTSQLLLGKPDLELTDEKTQHEEDETANIKSYHNCLVGSYMSYLKAAGYSKLPQEMRIFERGARRFLSKFPDPQEWVTLPVEEQYRCDHKERSFVHYLILRRLLPMPLYAYSQTAILPDGDSTDGAGDFSTLPKGSSTSEV